MTRSHAHDELRPIDIVPHFLDRHPASVLYSSGATRVLATATLQPGVPPFLEGRSQGWCTAEYSLLPGSTSPRHDRERGKVSGRTQEIQRLIGRSLRGVLDLSALCGYTLQVDCDVLQADGGTRTASINGGYVAVELAVRKALAAGTLTASPVEEAVGAVSAGLVGGQPFLDLNYAEDAAADVDLNVVLTRSGQFLEIQGTAEGQPFSRTALDGLVDLAAQGIEEILARCEEALASSA